MPWSRRSPSGPRPGSRSAADRTPLAVALGGDRLYVANGTNNAVAVVDLGPKASATPRDGEAEPDRRVHPRRLVPRRHRGPPAGAAALQGLLPPTREQLIVANIKGQGSRRPQGRGPVQLPRPPGLGLDRPGPAADRLEDYTRQVAENNRQALALAGLEPRRADARAGRCPSAMASLLRSSTSSTSSRKTEPMIRFLATCRRATATLRLVMFPREVTPNQHALAEEFVLLDNFYCSGVLSADGHAWATEAYATDYLERHFGGFIRSYPYDGDDPLAYASSGFLWDNALAHGKTFRDYGEFIKARISRRRRSGPTSMPTTSTGTDKVKVEARPTVETLRPHFCPTFIGFPATVPDVYRAREFLKEFREFEAGGRCPT